MKDYGNATSRDNEDILSLYMSQTLLQNKICRKMCIQYFRGVMNVPDFQTQVTVKNEHFSRLHFYALLRCSQCHKQKC